MILTHYFKYILFITFLLSIASNVSASQECKRYDKFGFGYRPDANYKFYDGVTTCKTLDAFLDKLEAAAKSDDPDKIAELISYPCNFNNKKTIKIKNKTQFKKLYRKIFTDVVKKIAINGEVSEVGSRGFMIGSRGTIWFFPDKGIIAINET